jgi:sphingomyelin phosphodiesterase 2
MTVIRTHAGLHDAWESLHPASEPATSPYVDPRDAITVYGVTTDSPMNSYSAGKPLDAHAHASQGKRLDYVLFRNPSLPRSGVEQPTLSCSHSRVMLTEPVPGCPFSYSDHFGLEATLVIKHPEAKNETLLADSDAEAAVPSISATPAPAHAPAKPPYLSTDVASTVLRALQTCVGHSASRAHVELQVFGACLALDVFLIVAAALWRSPWLTPLFVLLTAVTTWLGTTMLYVGFVYGRWEVNALRNVIEELDLYVLNADAVGRRSVEGTDFYRSRPRA